MNELTEIAAEKNRDAPKELECQEGVEDFACAPFWHRPGESEEAPKAGEAPKAPGHLTLSQALDLLEVEIAKRRQAEEGIREHEERFRQMSRYLGKFLWLSDPHTNKLIYVSPGYEQIWQTKREVCYARYEHWLEEASVSPKDEVHVAAASGKKSELPDNEYQAVGPEGSLRWIRERTYPTQDGSGKTLYILGIAEDITELKLLETAFAKTESVRRAFLRLVPDMLLRVRSDGTILEFKAAKDDPALRPAVKLRGRNLKNLVPEPMLRQATQCLQRALSTGRVQSLALEYPVAEVLREFEVRCVACGEGEVLVLAREVKGRNPAP